MHGNRQRDAFGVPVVAAAITHRSYEHRCPMASIRWAVLSIYRARSLSLGACNPGRSGFWSLAGRRPLMGHGNDPHANRSPTCQGSRSISRADDRLNIWPSAQAPRRADAPAASQDLRGCARRAVHLGEGGASHSQPRTAVTRRTGTRRTGAVPRPVRGTVRRRMSRSRKKRPCRADARLVRVHRHISRRGQQRWRAIRSTFRGCRRQLASDAVSRL